MAVQNTHARHNAFCNPSDSTEARNHAREMNKHRRSCFSISNIKRDPKGTDERSGDTLCPPALLERGKYLR